MSENHLVVVGGPIPTPPMVEFSAQNTFKPESGDAGNAILMQAVLRVG